VVAKVRAWKEERDQLGAQLASLDGAVEQREDLAERVADALAQLRRLDEVVREAEPATARAALAAVVGKITVHLKRAEKTCEMELERVDVEMADAVVHLFVTSFSSGVRAQASRCWPSVCRRSCRR